MKSIQRTLLEFHLLESRPYFKGFLLNAGCGDTTYEFIYKNWVESQIRYDWPKTVHDMGSIDIFGSVMELPFADNSFDIILCTEVLEHVPEPEKTLMEFHRVIQPGGTVILSVPFLYQMHEQPHDFFRYTSYGLKYLFEQAGFKLISCEARGEIIAVTIYFFRKLANRLLSKILGIKISRKLPFMILDWLYLKLLPKKLFHMDGTKTNYTLGYTVIAKKN